MASIISKREITLLCTSFNLHAVWSIRVLNIRASTQIWQKNKSNLRVFPVLGLISQEYPQYSISDTKGNGNKWCKNTPLRGTKLGHLERFYNWKWSYWSLKIEKLINILHFLLISFNFFPIPWPWTKGTIRMKVLGTGTCKSSEYWKSLALRVV